MIVNGLSLLAENPFRPMEASKKKLHGVSHGLAEAGYDVRIKQSVTLHPFRRFRLASTVEHFNMPFDCVAIVHDKSTWARRGLSVFNTVVEPGWHGWLTLELVYHGNRILHIPAGAGIAQVLFHRLENTSAYTGKYQGQIDQPVAAIKEKG
jgi:dCTP deaminase